MHHVLYFMSVLLGGSDYYFQITCEEMAVLVVTCQGHRLGAEPRGHPVSCLIQPGSKPAPLSEFITQSFHGHLPWWTMNSILGARILTNLLLHFMLPLVQCMTGARKRFAEGKSEERTKEKKKEARNERVIC